MTKSKVNALSANPTFFSNNLQTVFIKLVRNIFKKAKKNFSTLWLLMRDLGRK